MQYRSEKSLWILQGALLGAAFLYGILGLLFQYVWPDPDPMSFRIRFVFVALYAIGAIWSMVSPFGRKYLPFISYLLGVSSLLHLLFLGRQEGFPIGSLIALLLIIPIMNLLFYAWKPLLTFNIVLLGKILALTWVAPSSSIDKRVFFILALLMTAISLGVVRRFQGLTAEIKDREQQVRDLFHHSMDGMAICQRVSQKGETLDLVFLELNERFEVLVQRSREDILGKKGRQVWDENEHRIFLACFEEVFGCLEPREFEEYLPSSKKHYRVLVCPLGTDRFALFLSDRSKQVQEQRDLKEKTAFIEGLIRSVPDIVVYIFDLQTKRNVYVSEAIEKLLGYKQGPLLAMEDTSLKEYIHPEDYPLFLRHLGAVKNAGIETTHSFTFRIRHALGHWVWLETRDTGFRWDEKGRPLQILGAAFDISKKRQAEEELKKRDTLLRGLFQQFPGAIYQLQVGADNNLHVPFVSEGIQEIYAFTPEELKLDGNRMYARIHPEDVKEVRDSMQLSFTTQRLWEKEYRVLLPGQGLRFIQAVAAVERISSQEVLMNGYLRDVTETRETERQLKESQQLHEALVLNIPGAIFRCRYDKEWTMEYCSDRIEEITGYTPEELVLNQKTSYGAIIYEEDQLMVYQRIEEAKNNNEPYSMDYRVVHLDGTLRWIHEHAQVLPFLDSSRIYGVLTDVTKEKELELELQESRERFSQITETISEVCWLYRENPLEILYVNPAYETVWGRPCRELYENPASFMDSIHEEDKKRVQEALDSVPSSALHLTYRIYHQKGDLRFVKVRILPVYDGEGRVIRYVGSAKDVTQQQQVHDALAASKERYQQISDNAQVVLFQFERSLHGHYGFTYMSSKVEEITGIPPEEIAEDYRVLFHRVHPDHQRRMEQLVSASLRNQTDYHQVFLLNSDKGEIWLEARAMPTVLPTGGVLWNGVFIDIDKLKRTEDALEKERDRLRNIIEGTNAGTWECNLQTGEASVNEHWARTLGYTLEELEPFTLDTFFRLLHPEDKEIVDEAVKQHVKGHKEYYDTETRMQHKDGRYRWIHGKGKVVSWLEDGAPGWMFGIHIDITKRKESEEKLLESEAWFRALYEQSSVSIIVHDAKTGEVLAANPATHEAYQATTLTDFLRYEAMGPPYSKKEALEWLKKAVAEGPQAFEWKRLDSNGEVAHKKVHLIPLQLANEQRVLATSIDITDLKQAEKKLQDYAKELELSSLEREKLYRALDAEVQGARFAYRHLVKQQLPELEGMSLSEASKPATFMGGDFSYAVTKGEHLILCILDITGHDLEGTLFGLFVKTCIASYIELTEEPTPVSILTFLDKQVRNAGYPSEYAVAIFVVVVHLVTKELSFSAAGFQNPPLIVSADGTIQELVSYGLPISPDVPPFAVEFEHHTTRLLDDAFLFLATDGIYEATQGEVTYEKRLVSLLQESIGLPADTLRDRVLQDFLHFLQGQELQDDISFLVLSTQRVTRYAVPSLLPHLDTLRDYTLSFYHTYEDKENIAFGVHELAANAMEHGNKLLSSKTVRLEFSPRAVVIQDEGYGFSWTPVVWEDAYLAMDSPQGRGLVLTNSFVGELVYNQKGNRVSLILRWRCKLWRAKIERSHLSFTQRTSQARYKQQGFSSLSAVPLQRSCKGAFNTPRFPVFLKYTRCLRSAS